MASCTARVSANSRSSGIARCRHDQDRHPEARGRALVRLLQRRVRSLAAAGKPRTGGIDVGLEAFATLPMAPRIENPRYFKTAQAQLRRAQRQVARRKQRQSSAPQSGQALATSACAYWEPAQRFSSQDRSPAGQSVRLDLRRRLHIKGLASGMLAKAVHDVGWGMFLLILLSKAAEAGRVGRQGRCPWHVARMPLRGSRARKHSGIAGITVRRVGCRSREIMRPLSVSKPGTPASGVNASQ